MPRFAANLSWLFTELPFPERFAAAAAAGFEAVEYLFPYDHAVEDIQRWQQSAGVRTVLFNLPPGDWASGERGLAAQPGREQAFGDGLEQALRYARALGVKRLHAMAGRVRGDLPQGLQRACYVDNLRSAAAKAASSGIEILIEAINPADMPGYYLDSVERAISVIDEVGAANLRLQFDAYHVHRLGDDVLSRLSCVLPYVAHVQIAGSPGRGEPDSGTLDYRALFLALDAAAYPGWIGCEYRPQRETRSGLAWRDRLTPPAAFP